MRKIQNITFAVLLAIAGGFTALFIYTNYLEEPKVVTIKEKAPNPVQYTKLSSSPGLTDLTYAAEISVKSVVHIQTQYQMADRYPGGNPLLEFFYGDRYYQDQPKTQQASGSGVIITEDGYIATNNHVIENSDAIKVVLNDNREYEATLVGTDPSTDIALLKIKNDNDEKFPAIRWGNSDQLKLGEWVLAVGNPFNLTSTVTAGIVSAKARGIGIIGGQLPIESFIQTDAAVNPGNSGGALVNNKGELVGINTAIASRTGSYSGYSFAVPVSIVKKVTDDLKEFGEVQRALLGVQIRNIDGELAEELDLDKIEGVYVAATTPDGAAEEAGIEAKDVILEVNNVKVNTVSELQEQISKHRPGDEITILLKRDKKEKLFNTTLRNTRGGVDIIKDSMTVLGAEFEELSDRDKERLEIRNGLKIKDLYKGKLKDAGVREGFILVYMNKQPISNVQELKEVLKMSSGGVLLEGIYPNGEEAYYVFSIK